ncbi:MAG: ABC transporter permease [Flavobacteriaceae bacterium]|nr:ABC transporter permease [Flavobacteriaceae bacterium]
MLSYALKKVLYALITLFGVVSVIFFLFYLIPGDPAQMMLGQNENADQLKQLRSKYGFDQPMHQQYLYYLNDLSPLSLHSTDPVDFTFDDGRYTKLRLAEVGTTVVVLKTPYLRQSFQKNGKPVSNVIAETLPNTVVLAIASISIALIVGMLLGIISAIKKDSWLDKSIQVVSTLGMSIPSFFSAILFAWFFGFILHQYTGLNMTGSLYELDDLGNAMQLHLKNLVLPAVVLGIRPLAVVVQLMRNSLLDVLQQEYIRTAFAKGLTKTQVIYRHALKNALNPIITALSGWFASMLAGAVFVEYIFNWNGLGKELVDALNTLDLPIIMGAIIVIATSFIIINILVDIVYAILDPRISLQ